MKRTSFPSGLAAVAALAVLGGCRAKSSPPAQNTAPARPPSSGVLPSSSKGPKPGGKSPNRPGSVPSNAAASKAIAVTIRPDKTVYRRGEVVHFTVAARNTGKQVIGLGFASGQNFEITAVPAGQKPDGKTSPLWAWGAGKMFPQFFQTKPLSPGKALSFTATWDQKESSGNPMPRGQYDLRATLMANGGLPSEPVVLTLKD